MRLFLHVRKHYTGVVKIHVNHHVVIHCIICTFFFSQSVQSVEVIKQSKHNSLYCSHQCYVTMIFLMSEVAVFGIRECPQTPSQI